VYSPYTIAEVHCPQVVVLKEPNSRNWFTVNIEGIKPFNTATPTTLNSILNDGHYKVEEVLKEHTTDTGRHESTRSSGLATPTATTAGSQKRTFTPTVYLSSSKQVGAQQPWTECGAPRTVLRLVGGGESGGFPMEFQSPHSGNSSQR